MGRFYKTYTRWTPVQAGDVKKAVVEEVKKEEVKVEPVVETIEEVLPSATIEVFKTPVEGGFAYTISVDGDYDEIRYNVGARKVTSKNKTKCKLYEGEFILEEDSVINASAFKGEELICSVQG